MSRQRVILIGLAFVALAGVGVAIYWWYGRPEPLPRLGTAVYQDYQRAFQVGTAALDAGRDDIVLPNLDRAIGLVPGEPAAWANRGVFHLRKNNFESATRDLKKAYALAPDSGEIETLLALLADKQGRFADSVAHLRKAVALRPEDLSALYALAQAVKREGGADADVEHQKLLERILKVQPRNLYVLTQRANAALRNKDDAAFKDTLDQFTKLAPAWSEQSRQQFEQVRKAPPNDLQHTLTLLGNVLKQERGYVRDASVNAELKGKTVQRFLRLEPTRPTPAPPDRELAFKLSPDPAKVEGRWDVMVPAWMVDEQQRLAVTRNPGIAVRAADLFKAVMFVANASEVRRADGQGQTLPFPSGPKKIAPSLAGVLAIDWDNDHRTDLLLAGAGGLRFWHQNADTGFAEVTKSTGLPADILNGDYFGAWAADIEMDGDLDIIVARRSGPPLVLRNNGDGTFKALEPFGKVKDVRAFAWADLDNDGAPDAAFLTADGALHVFANDRSGNLSAWPLPADLGKFVAIVAADVNDDGVFDLVAARSDGALLRISDLDKRAKWETAELARWPIPANAEVGAVTLYAADFDNNGAIDIAVSAPGVTHVVLADEGGKWMTLTKSIPLAASMIMDVNNDGRLDLVGLSAEGQPARALNESAKGYRWQSIWPLANLKILEDPIAGDNRINSFAIGSEAEIRAGVLVQKQMVTGPYVHFGLGEQIGADVVRIVWPNGIPQWEFEMPAERHISAVQRLGGSCPFLFTYDGTGMRFVGDFMWGTPLGMYVNGQNVGDFPQTTEWLKIRGEHLVPRDGYYDVRVHANLWETDYFDQLALIVVDHPPDTEIHVDERFFLTPTPPKMYVTTPAKPVARAWDHHGKDATDEIRAIDGVYLDRAGRGRFQGVTKDHWVEVDLGDDAPKDGPVVLIARGWLHPTNSSINFALAQGKHDPPRPLSLEVPDGKGGWKVALPALGFPAGKDKTMLIRLDAIDGKGVARRFRLRTSMEIYWDFLGYATELDVKLARLQRPTPSGAELRFRGVLEMTQKNVSSPEVPHYDKVIHGPQQWRDLTGYYTRFGDVRELLEKVDDRYVIMNAGDEIALRFPVPAAPPAGWKRDFIWECDGWTRDGDMNTRFGNSVLPLPAHGKNDDRPPGRLQDDPVYRRFPLDWRNYHTRYVTDDGFARGLRR